MSLFVQGTFTNGLKDVRDSHDPNWTALFTPEEWSVVNYDRAKADEVKAEQAPDFEKNARDEEADLVNQSSRVEGEAKP